MSPQQQEREVLPAGDSNATSAPAGEISRSVLWSVVGRVKKIELYSCDNYITLVYYVVFDDI